MSETLEIKLPQAPSKPTKEVPSSMIIFGLPKCGKTTTLSELPNFLNIDVEAGSDFVEGMKLQPPKDISPMDLYDWFKVVCKKIKDAGRPYDFVGIDTISFMDEKAEWIGTELYMDSVQGKKFNRDSSGKRLSYGHPDYESVHTLGEGYGYKYSRKVMTDIMDMSKDLGKICTIFVCHVTDKYVLSKQSNTEVKSLDLSLTGKVRQIYSRDVDAIGYIYNKGGDVHISFKGNEEKLGGMRGNKHIQGYEGKLDWNQIFKLK